MDIDRLRQETAAEHDAVEGSIPLMTEELDVKTYVSCLRRIHGFVAAWERSAAVHTPEWMRPMLKERRRQGLLEDDLACFGIRELDPGSGYEMPPLTDTASFLGAMYVMEGSTLGGQYIARHVERVLKLTDGRGSAYFRGYNERTGSMWKEFCEVLRNRVADDEADDAIAGAKAMFRAFGAWMRAGVEEPMAYQLERNV
jgi:heme oxygenase (biliverdin-IX-beta and delta-forming)